MRPLARLPNPEKIRRVPNTVAKVATGEPSRIS
jgi:hypothetical protein